MCAPWFNLFSPGFSGNGDWAPTWNLPHHEEGRRILRVSVLPSQLCHLVAEWFLVSDLCTQVPHLQNEDIHTSLYGWDNNSYLLKHLPCVRYYFKPWWCGKYNSSKRGDRQWKDTVVSGSGEGGQSKTVLGRRCHLDGSDEGSGTRGAGRGGPDRPWMTTGCMITGVWLVARRGAGLDSLGQHGTRTGRQSGAGGAARNTGPGTKPAADVVY